ncbi:MAG: hypothetical protein JWQ08_1466 [Deinococcus sp.]|nr:hypothetical protein [Deinococcus sp.]
MARANAGGDPWARATLGHVYALLGLAHAARRHDAAALESWQEDADGSAGAVALACTRAWVALRTAEAEPQAALWNIALERVHNATITPSPLAAQLWLALARGLREAGEALPALRALQGVEQAQRQSAARHRSIPAEVLAAEWRLALLNPNLSNTNTLLGPSATANPPSRQAVARRDAQPDLLGPDARALQALAQLKEQGTVGALTELADALAAVERVDLRRTCAFALAEGLSVLGIHHAALAAMHAYPMFPQPTGPRDWACRGVLLRRQHHDCAALRDIDAALSAPETLPPPIRVKAALHRADLLYRQNRIPEALGELRNALPALVALSVPALLAPDLGELTTLMQLAALEPDLSDWAEKAYQAANQREPEAGEAEEGWTLQTLGQATLRRAGQPVPLRWPETALLIAYLALQGEVTRTQAELDLFPDLPPKVTLARFRQALAELRAHLGPEAVRVGGPKRYPTYTLTVPVSLDVQKPSVVAAAAGLFLPLLPHTGWVAERRTLHRLTDQHFIDQHLTHPRAGQPNIQDQPFKGYG